jgi:hypothetical protein
LPAYSVGFFALVDVPVFSSPFCRLYATSPYHLSMSSDICGHGIGDDDCGDLVVFVVGTVVFSALSVNP